MATDEENAEAALIALGWPLEWVQRIRTEPRVKRDVAGAPDGYYTVRSQARAGVWSHTTLFTSYDQCATELCPFTYKRRTEAETASERHHATGKWE